MNKEVHDFIVRMAKGDMDALGGLYDMLSVRIFNYARLIAKNKEMAEDVTHDVFIKIHEQSSRLTKISDPTAYIMVTTRNKTYDYLKPHSRTTISLDDASEVSISNSNDRVLIWDAFSQLDTNQQEAAYLHYFYGFTQKEVAKITGVSLITVKRRCAKALSQIQSYFKENEEDNFDEITRYNNPRPTDLLAVQNAGRAKRDIERQSS